MPPRRRRVYLWILLSLGLSTLLLIPLVDAAVPRVYRWHMLRKLDATEQARRQEGLNYVARRAGDDPHVLRGAVARLDEPDNERFLHLMRSLDAAGQWKRPPAPDAAWLRWLELVAGDADASARVIVAQKAADLADLAQDPRLQALVQRLYEDDSERVRMSAALAAAELIGALFSPPPGRGPVGEDWAKAYERLLVQATADPMPAIARDAWILLGLLDPTSGIRADWRQAPREVAPAMLWAAVATNLDQPRPAIEALHDPTAAPELRAVAAYALALSRPPAAAEALRAVLRAHPPATVDAGNQKLVWRAVLALPLTGGENGAAEVHQWAAGATRDATAHLPAVLLAAAHRTGTPYHFSLPGTGARRVDEERDLPAELMTLALLEGGHPPPPSLAIAEESPDLLHILSVAAAPQPDPQRLRPVLGAGNSNLRDLACAVAARRLFPQQNASLIVSLLNDLNDDAKRSGAILAGLTGQELDLLERKLHDEDDWSVQQIQKLGLWVQERMPEFGEQVPGLLGRRDLPATTILLALLHRDRQRALDYLIAPRGEEPQWPRRLIDPDAASREPVSLWELLAHYRWWHVLRPYLPEDAPPLWLWADPELQQFQIDVLRNWYLLHRRRMASANP